MRGQFDEAETYYRRAISFAQQIDATESGYYHYSLLHLGEIAEEQGDRKQARNYYKKVKKEAKRSSRAHEKARQNLQDMRRRG